MSRSILFAAALAVAGLAAPAALAEKPAVREISVSYADLNLSGQAGAETLLRRINKASTKVCGKRPMTLAFGQFERWSACRHAAIGNAVARVDNPAVTLAFNQSAGAARIQLASR
jgi:UrcA family protein